MGNFMKQLQQAQQVMQVEAVKVQKEMQEAEFEGFSSDETVRVVMSGNQEAKGCDITQAAYSQGADALGVLVTEAYKDAHEKSVTAMKDRMKGLASSLGLPENPNM
jgi:DNA-binding protein YbaB